MMPYERDSYRLRSYDGGEYWLAFDEDGMVLGDAEEIYPGLVARNKAFDALTDYVTKNGPITNLNSLHEIELLEAVGFEVKSTEEE